MSQDLSSKAQFNAALLQRSSQLIAANAVLIRDYVEETEQQDVDDPEALDTVVYYALLMVKNYLGRKYVEARILSQKSNMDQISSTIKMINTLLDEVCGLD
jgi:hypothetical protein